MEQPATVVKFGIDEWSPWILYSDGTLKRFSQLPAKHKDESEEEDEED
jgi:hypothetical protein